MTTILANDPFTVLFNSVAYFVTESAGTVTLQVDRAGGTTGAFTVNVTFGAPGNATGGTVDYDSLTQVVTFGPSDTSQTLTVPITDDQLAEATETMTATLTGLVDASGQGAIAGQTATTVVIHNNDLFTVFFNSGIYFVDEGSGPAVIQVARTALIQGAFTVEVSFGLPGNATGGGTDYASATQLVTFNATDTVVAVNVPINNDTLAEATEGFTATLGNLVDASGQGTIAGQTTTEVFITDNDAYTLFFDAAAYAVDEDAGTVTMRLRRTAGVTWDPRRRRHLWRRDRDGGRGPTTTRRCRRSRLRNGDEFVDFTVAIVNDTLAEDAETFVATLGNLV